MGKNYFTEYYNPGISFSTVGYIFLISLVFIVGSKFNLNIKENYLTGIILFLVIFLTFKRFEYYSIILSLLALMIIIMVKKNYFSIYYRETYVLGLLLCFLNILILGKLPLLNPEIRELSLTPLFVLGYSFVLVSNNFGILKSRYPNYLIFPMVSLLLFILYGFRTYIIILILSTMIMFYLLGKKEKTLYFALVGSIITIVLGYITILLLPQNWKLNPFELLWYRVTFTFDVFDKICATIGLKLFGNYSLLTETTTGYIISQEILNYSHNITSTIFGPPIFDGGIIEVMIFTLFVSISLFKLYNKTKTNKLLIPYYSLILSIFIVSIEISPYPLILLLIPLSIYISSLNSSSEQL
ncbi:MAG: hypothetical protein APG12_00931 [Candidatus Methanofastidiosum methylothiophilum]|uniref:O-Antigen ligase n=1 Tax=Candidatus Methanofastidiosum methylothiophilum TaxID=1705564 RepID=A0A150IRP9_9EURY|nr:MAG: hypothetical protein APG10_00745 [Candidatus Methanofastidiosum methylthiophilus]KYC47592.1 MAG: hypothetical protein APG11_00998 [Candidatus Methanofastidiosum methylthiophilus]KYC50209.1 MAG: hypothetical protein APG12_00931 [Candidatus Methanofastidiosum methylthiophilus]